MHTHCHIHTQRIYKHFFSSTACVSGCDFDTVGNLCEWVTATENPDIFGFEQSSGAGSSPGTGPNDDFSKPGCEFSFFTSLKGQIMKNHVPDNHQTRREQS